MTIGEWQLFEDIHKNFPDKETRIVRAKAYAEKWGLEIRDGKLIAYRHHTPKGSGVRKFATCYEPGKVYKDFHCDPRSGEEASFGFGIWPDETSNTVVAVPLEDFVVAVDNDRCGKARVLSFEVLS
jgi:hypothetical protein